MTDDSARRTFRVLTRTRGGYDGGIMYDVQLQSVATGNLMWAQTFTDQDQAMAFETELANDLDTLAEAAFRRKYGVPSTA